MFRVGFFFAHDTIEQYDKLFLCKLISLELAAPIAILTHFGNLNDSLKYL